MKIIKQNQLFQKFSKDFLINLYEIFDHTNWPDNREELTRYGEEELKFWQNFMKKRIIEINNICEE